MTTTALRADHPNALWLADLYSPADGQDDAQRVEAVMRRVSPDFVIHTGGIRLATTGGLAFMRRYAQRRAELGGPAPVEIYQILADDHFAIIYARFRAERGSEVRELPGMGAWRFDAGMAVEHWEMPDGPDWDRFYLPAHTELSNEQAAQYWR